MELIVEFRAGLMRTTEGRLSADSRKGLIRVCQDEAGLMHFCWVERDAAGTPMGDPEKDIVILPGECTFGKIPRPGSRVFELKFPEEKHRNTFFWAQEPDAGSDEDYCAAINFALSQEAGQGFEGEQQAMETEPSGAAAVPTAAAAPTAAPAAAAGSFGGAGSGGGASGIGAADLAAMLGSIMSGASGAPAGRGRQRQVAADPGPTLGDVLKPEALAPLLREADMVARLAPYLPEEHRSAAAIAELVSTPQFRHQLDLLSHALMTGQLDTRQFGLPPGGFGVLDFLKGIQAEADKERSSGGGRGEQPEPGDGGACGEGQPQ